MKTLPVGLAAHIAGGTTTLADLLKITRTDGTVFSFTSAANDVTISSVLYKSAQGLNISSLESSAGLNVDNLELSTLDDGTVFTKLDVLSGRWRNADFVISRYNWANPADGVDVRMVGTIGEVRLHRGYVTAELRGLQQYLQQPIGSVSSKTCRARLGDAMCGVNLTPFTFSPTVGTVTNNQVFEITSGGASPGDLLYASVSLLLHCNGTNGSTTITDNAATPKTVTAMGNAQISTAQSKFGGASVLLDGTGDYLTTPDNADFSFGTGDFTIEMWVNFSVATSGASYSLLTQGLSAFNSNAGFYFARHSSNNLRFIFTDDGTGTSGYKICDTPFTPTTGVWYHLAVVRNGTSIKTYINGVSSGSLTSSAAIYNSTRAVVVGADESGASAFNGYIDEVRITKGNARYTANFTPDTAEFYNSLPAYAWPAEADYFANGILTWLTGVNAGVSAKVKSSTAVSVLTLSLPMLGTVAPGDTATIYAGCQKRLTDCSTKFSNVLNFQAEPHLPGIDEVTQ